MSKPNTTWAFITIGLGAALACVLPWLLTSRSWLGISFHDTGPVGDTIGGIAGPVLNFAGLLVIYFSLREQLVANYLQREALDDQKQQIEAEKRESQNEKYFELTYTLLEKLADSVHRNETVFAEVAQHDYWWNFDNTLAASDKEHEDADKKWLGYVWKIRGMLSLFSLIMDRMDNEILTLDQKQLLASLVELQYISKLDECRIAYQGLFEDTEKNPPEQLIIIDDQRIRLFQYQETLRGRIAENSIPWG